MGRNRKRKGKKSSLYNDVEQYYYEQKQIKVREEYNYNRFDISPPQPHHFDLDDIIEIPLSYWEEKHIVNIFFPPFFLTWCSNEQYLEHIISCPLIPLTPTDVIDISNRIQDKERVCYAIEQRLRHELHDFLMEFRHERIKSTSFDPSYRHFNVILLMESFQILSDLVKKYKCFNIEEDVLRFETCYLELDWKTFYEITTHFHVDGNTKSYWESRTLLESHTYRKFDPISFIVAFISIYYGGANRIREEMTTKFNNNEEEGEYFTLSHYYWPELMNTEHDCTLED